MEKYRAMKVEKEINYGLFLEFIRRVAQEAKLCTVTP
jgi:hypothetical protein